MTRNSSTDRVKVQKSGKFFFEILSLGYSGIFDFRLSDWNGIIDEEIIEINISNAFLFKWRVNDFFCEITLYKFVKISKSWWNIAENENYVPWNEELFCRKQHEQEWMLQFRILQYPYEKLFSNKFLHSNKKIY